jgi:prephenate dehydratase
MFFTFDEDVPGQLYTVMGEFAQRGINLAKIESRPTKRSLGQYIFLIDCDGHREDLLLGEAIQAVGDIVSTLRVMGSYPKWVQESSAGA